MHTDFAPPGPNDPAAKVQFLARAKAPAASLQAETSRVRTWLRRASNTEEAISWLLQGDPLNLLSRTADNLRKHARILDPVRVNRYSVARVAFRSFGWRGKPELDSWLARCIDEAIRDALSEDEERERNQELIDDRQLPQYAIMIELLGCQPELARILMLTFNRLPIAERMTAHAVLLLGHKLDEVDLPQSVCAQERRPSRELFAAAMSALEAAIPGRIPPPAPDEYDLSSANDA